MIVDIQIDCENQDEIIAHLETIKKQLRKEFRKQPMLQSTADRFETIVVSDNNCYGIHNCMVRDIEKRPAEEQDPIAFRMLQDQVLDLDKSVSAKVRLLTEAKKLISSFCEECDLKGLVEEGRKLLKLIKV